MDWRSEPGLPLKSRRADLLILALAALLLRGGERVGALGSGLGPVWGQGALDRFGDAMTRRGESLPRLGPEAPAVLAGDFLDPPEASADLLERLGGRGHLLVILDPAEIDLPYEGRTRFVGLEGESETTIRRAQDLRPAYSEALARHRDALAAIARARGWSLTLHRTDEPPQVPLLALWRLLSEAPE